MDSGSGSGYKSEEIENTEDFGKAIVFTTTRHRCKLQQDGYFYVFDKMSTNGQKKFWRCEKKTICNARIHTDAQTNKILKRATQHNHPSGLIRPSMQRKTLKRHSDGSLISENDEMTAKRNIQSLEALLQEIVKTSGFDSQQNEKTAKKEYGDIISHCRIRSFSPNRIISYSKQISQEAGAISSANRISNEENDGFQSLLHLISGGFTFWSSEITKIVDEGAQFCSMATNSNFSKSFSLLIKGAEKAGKSCLATLIAKNSGIPSIKVCLPENLLEFDEEAKKAKLIELFKEASKLPHCILFLDGLELLIEYCDVGDRYSNTMLQTVKLILKRGEMLEHNRLLVIATVTSECAEKFGLQRYFSSVIQVPLLTKIERMIPIIEYANILNKDDFQMLRECVVHETNSYPIGIKSLLTAIELVKHSRTTSRFRTLLHYLLQWKQ
uniref:Vesicle-fusing ATPase n=1 Tax=Setaria digitata TaxID=48799 RepID=A0A915PFT3_9BILA